MGADDSYNARLSQQLRTAEARIEQLEAALREVGEMLADIDDPKTASGHCMFCGHRIGTSVFGVDLYIKNLHEPNCAWLTLRALEADQ